jgi:hypothetical protein
MASFPILTDILFTYLARENHKRYPTPAACSDFSVTNRNNVTLASVRTGSYLNEASKQLQLLRFHLTRMRDNFDTLQSQDTNFTKLPKVKKAYKTMEKSTCDKTPFEPGDAVVNAVLAGGDIQEGPEPLTKNQLLQMPRNEIEKLCLNYTFSCDKTKITFWRTKEWIAERVAKAMADGHATWTNVWGACTKNKQCHEPGTSCQWSNHEKRHRCMCSRKYCYRNTDVTTHRCVKADGKSKERAFGVLQTWIERTELRVGLYANQLKQINNA